MKILIIRTWPDELNINNYNSQEIGLAKSLINNGHICDIVLYTKGQNKIDYYAFNDKKIKIYYIKAINFFKNAIFDKAIFNIIDNYDVIQTAEYDQIFNIKLYKHCPEKLVIFHGPYKSEFTKGYKKKIMISDFLYKFFREYKNTPVISKSELATKFLYEKGFKNVFTIGVGLDDSRFTNVVSNKKLDELITSKNNCKYMLYIGKIEERRNIKFLVDRFYDYNKTNQNSKLILVGKGTVKYKNMIFDYIKDKKIDKSVVYIENLSQEEVQNLYKNCDLFLMPSQYEIFGMVMLETMFFGLPIITTLNGGSSVLIENEKNGFIAELNDLTKWNDYICNVLNDENYHKVISQNAKKTISEEFVWNKLVNKYLMVYNDVYDKG